MHAITEFCPDIVGISSVFSMFESDATEIAELVKDINKKTIVLLGGVTATIEDIFIPLLKNNSSYDIMIRGEGEKTLRELLQNYDSKTKKICNLQSIDGIAFLDDNNNLVCTPQRIPITDLDSLPFPSFDLLNVDTIISNKYYSRWRNNPLNKRTLPVFTSRGCPYDCCFCSVHSQVGYKYRTYSVDYIVKLISYCIEFYGINHFHFEDDNLTLDMERAKELFSRIAEFDITWDTPNGVRADRIDEELLELMIKSGLTCISIAAESGSENVRCNIIHKNLKDKDIINVAKMCHDSNLPCIVFFVLGFPGETIEDIIQTIRFAKMLTDNYYTINMLFVANPLPGTELNREAQKKGYIKKEMTNSDYFKAIRLNQANIIETPEFSKKTIFNTVKNEINNSDYIVHNISLPMFWSNNQIAEERARKVFPKMSNKKVVWEWID